MLTDELIEKLRFKGEGSDLDYKSERYQFAKASDDAKSELLKDILALANTHRDGTAYILMGFKENAPEPAEVVGLTSKGGIDDSRLQEFVNAKLETKLAFRYEERLFGGQNIAVISVPKQQRPFYLKKNYGRLKKDIVFVRRGSSTGIASPREIAMMGAANTLRGEPKVLLSFLTPNNEPMQNAFERQFLVFSDNLPDYESRRNSPLSGLLNENTDYWRDAADYLSSSQRVVQARLQLVNQSEFSLSDTKLEVCCRCPDGETVSLLRADNMPDEPDTSNYGNLARNILQRDDGFSIDERGSEPVAHIVIANVRPGQTSRAEDDLALLPSGAGSYLLEVRIFSNELSDPLLEKLAFEVSGPTTQLDFSNLRDLAVASSAK